MLHPAFVPKGQKNTPTLSGRGVVDASVDPDWDWSRSVTKAARSVKGFGPTLEDLVWDNPEVAAIILQECGITADDFQDVLNNYNRKH